MAVQTLSVLKSWFISQAKPTQEQFWDLLDSYRHANSKIAFADLTTELQQLFNNTAGNTPVLVEWNENTDNYFLMPKERRLDAVSIINKSSNDMTLSFYCDNDSWTEEQVLEVGKSLDVVINHTFWEEDNVHVDGITGNIGMRIHKS